MTEFHFEHTYTLSESEYVEIYALSKLRGPQTLLRRIVLAVVGVAALFWSYTLLLGIGVLALLTLHLVMPRLLPGTAARNYAKLKYLHGPVTYGVDGHRLWLRSEDFAAEAGWPHLAVWRERGRWLVLSALGIPPIVLPMDEMRAQGIHDEVLKLARRYGVEFNSPEAEAIAI